MNQAKKGEHNDSSSNNRIYTGFEKMFALAAMASLTFL
jgi:hypothetical protein